VFLYLPNKSGVAQEMFLLGHLVSDCILKCVGLPVLICPAHALPMCITSGQPGLWRPSRCEASRVQIQMCIDMVPVLVRKHELFLTCIMCAYLTLAISVSQSSRGRAEGSVDRDMLLAMECKEALILACLF
jgi:hypothetical protein